jgi:ABC-type spermidine/putrescine transport system, permease component II
MARRGSTLDLAALAFRGLGYLTMAFILLPLVAVVWVSFFSNRVIIFPPDGYTWSWYGAALADDSFRSGLLTSLWLALGAAAGSLAVGIPASFVLARRDFVGRGAINAFLLSPLMIPAIVAGSAVYLFFIQIEIVSGVRFAGTFHGLLLAHIVIAIPWTIRLMVASLLRYDIALEEAAISFGASPLQAIWRVTLPAVRPAVVAAALFSFIVSFVDLEKSLLLVGPGTTTLPIAIVNYIQWRLDPTIAAVSTLQILMVTVALVISDRFVRLTQTF